METIFIITGGITREDYQIRKIKKDEKGNSLSETVEQEGLTYKEAEKWLKRYEYIQKIILQCQEAFKKEFASLFKKLGSEPNS